MKDFYTSVDLYKNKILFRGYENGVRIRRKVDYDPYLFLIDPKKESKFKTISNVPVKKMEFKSVYEAKNFVKQYEEVENFHIYGSTNFHYVWLYDRYNGKIDYDNSKIKRCFLDVETMSDDGFPDIEKADKAITLITVKTNEEQYYTFGWVKPYSAKGRKNVSGIKHQYLKFKDEATMLANFLKWWNMESYTPDILTGWNIMGFDLPYLVNRIRRVLGVGQAEKLSPWLAMNERIIDLNYRKTTVYDPIGIAILDYFDLYKKFTYNQQESYRLDHIAQVELKKGKLDYSEHGSLHNFFVNDYDSFVDYNILDVVRVSELEDKMHLIDLALAMAYDAGVNYQDVLGTVKVWDTIIHNHLMDRNIVVNATKKGLPATIAGGYVKDPQVGMHRWVASFDLTSLYPHLIMQYNISPETYIGKTSKIDSIDNIIDNEKINDDLIKTVRNNDRCIAANGAMYKRDKQGFLGYLMKQQFSKRKEAQKEMIRLEKLDNPTEQDKADIVKYNLIQLAKKIQINSLYGALANQYFRWYDPIHAEAITLSGQLAIKWIAKKINDHLNKLIKKSGNDYVIASDTDSVYLVLSDFVDTIEQADEFCEQLNELIDEWYGELALSTNAFVNAMSMKREIIADKAIWVAKKRYIANVLDKEGVRYDNPKLKIMGIEAVRSSTPNSCREAIKDTLKIIMSTDELTVQKHIDKFRQEFKNLPFDQMASPRGVNGMVKYWDAATGYKLGTPIHVRGSLTYNSLVKSLGLENTYSPIIDKDKIKFCYLKIPNPIQCHVIACPDKLPKEFKLDAYLDHDKQFEIVFLEPIQKILTSIGWNAVKKATLDSFFE